MCACLFVLFHGFSVIFFFFWGGVAGEGTKLIATIGGDLNISVGNNRRCQLSYKAVGGFNVRLELYLL